MKPFSLILLGIAMYMNFNLQAENYLLNGGQNSKINYHLSQQITPTPQTISIDLIFVIPQTFNSPTYKQKIEDLNFSFTMDPEKSEQWIDKDGNKLVKYSWAKPIRSFNANISFTSYNSVSLNNITTTAPFPVKDIEPPQEVYLMSTKLVPADNPEITKLSQQLLKDCKTQFDAVQKILSWIIDHMQYVLTPDEYGALYSLKNGKGNCQNYSHLAAALMRASGIPVRIVNGVTLKRPFDVVIGNQILTLNMAQGRHSWIEVYFPDLGWMPFDPQQSELFVSNRFIRIEVGLDNEQTIYDGLVSWTREKGSRQMLKFQETIDADFINDEVSIAGDKQGFGPRKLLLQPAVEASFVAVETPLKKKPLIFDLEDLKTKKFDTPYSWGNLDFPEGINFAFIREIKESESGRTQELQKNFLVETAEYVTSKLEYAQIFILDRPMKLDKIGLALHKFGGTGKLWVELREDKDGFPGPVAAKSAIVDLNQLSLKPGYYWIDFDFLSQNLMLTPDKYWITIGYNGSPIVNWFYSYGKPVGPIDGTRYKEKSEAQWSKTLAYEFNYRVIGFTIPQ